MPSARRLLLPNLKLTNLAEEISSEASKVLIPATKMSVLTTYHTVPKLIHLHSTPNRSAPLKIPLCLKLFPLVVGRDGVPWAEANMWLLSKAQETYAPSMTTIASNADDLASYLRFIEETNIEWTIFEANKLTRPTYRYYSHLKQLIANNEVAHSTARRRMSSVIRFYKWLKLDGYLKFDYEPWKESERIIFFTDLRGFIKNNKVVTTDISIKNQIIDDPYDDFINDGGKLRALTQYEQQCILNALIEINNTEMTLIHLFSLLTGARLQSILTFQVHHVLRITEMDAQDTMRFAIGPGTGIDTKNDKKMVLHIPVWFYKLLQDYAVSHRAKKRRNRAVGGDNEEQYLFLSIRGTPLYYNKSDSTGARDKANKHHNKVGQAVRQFIIEKIIPYLKENNDGATFLYRFHDLRAAFGMNLMDSQLALVEQGTITLKHAIEFVKNRMSHESITTTERYLNNRYQKKMIRAAQDGWEAEIFRIATRGASND